MIATQITNHVAQAIDRLLQQYKGQPRIEAILTAFVEQIQEAENAIYSLDAGRQLSSAVGAQLDELGTLLNYERGGLSDAVYLIFLRGVIARNFSDGTLTAIREELVLLLDAEETLIFENFPAEFSAQFSDSSRDSTLFATIARFVQECAGAGIRFGSLTEFAASGDAFAFVGGNFPAKGFGDTGDPSLGGQFAEAVFTFENED